MNSEARKMLRHFVATLAYRGTNVLQNMPAEAALRRPDDSVRTPVEILNHINDVLTFALVQITDHEYQEPEPLDWNSEVARFYRLLTDIDKSLRTVDAHRVPCEKLLQGPLSDAMLHLGQIGIFRRMAGSPVTYENYFAADIVVGKLRTTDK